MCANDIFKKNKKITTTAGTSTTDLQGSGFDDSKIFSFPKNQSDALDMNDSSHLFYTVVCIWFRRLIIAALFHTQPLSCWAQRRPHDSLTSSLAPTDGPRKLPANEILACGRAWEPSRQPPGSEDSQRGPPPLAARASQQFERVTEQLQSHCATHLLFI